MKKFTLRSIIFVLVIFSIQTLIHFGLGHKDIMKTYWKTLETRPDVIMFGDSVFSRFNEEDKDKRSIFKMADELLPNITVGSINNRAYALEIYEYFCKSITASKKYKPKMVVISINLRSFSIGWNQKPEYQFEKEKVILTPKPFLLQILFKPLSVLKHYSYVTITRKKYESLPVYEGDKLIGQVGDFVGEKYKHYTDDRMKNKLMFRYMFKLKNTHESLLSAKRTAQILKDNNIPVIFYITPIDYQSGRKYLGKRFTERIRENSDLIIKTLSNEGNEVLDLSMDVGTKGFDWLIDKYPNEHLSEEGRIYVAKRVAERIKNKLYPR